MLGGMEIWRTDNMPDTKTQWTYPCSEANSGDLLAGTFKGKCLS